MNKIIRLGLVLSFVVFLLATCTVAPTLPLENS